MFGFFEQKANELWSVMAPELSDGEKCFSAVEAGRINDVRHWIQERSIDPNLKNEAGNTLIHVAAYNGREDIVRYLIDMGADARALGARLNSCLHYAAMEGHQNLVDFFIDKGLSPSAKNQNGRSPYDVAKGFTVKQKLMQLIFQEEARNGTAPVILGASRDRSKDEERLRNLPPPPKLNEQMPLVQNQNNPAGVQAVPPMGNVHTGLLQPPPPPSQGASAAPNPTVQSQTMHIPAANQSLPVTNAPPSTPPQGGPPGGQSQDPNYRPSAHVRRTIKENDGFVTTVGNPELAAKYGNKSSYRTVSGTGEAQAASAPTNIPPSYTGRTSSPFAQRGRYVTYDAVNNKAGQFTRPTAMPPGHQPVRPQGLPTQFSGQGNTNLNVFNPAQHQQFQQPSQQPQQPQQPQQQQFQQQSIPFGSSNPATTNNSSASPAISPTSRFGAPVAKPVSPARHMSRPITPPAAAVATNVSAPADGNSVEYTQGSFT